MSALRGDIIKFHDHSKGGIEAIGLLFSESEHTLAAFFAGFTLPVLPTWPKSPFAPPMIVPATASSDLDSRCG